LKQAEKKLIDEIRAIECGEIELVKIQHGLPVYYKIRLQEELFDVI
jgi:hypothetical protein